MLLKFLKTKNWINNVCSETDYAMMYLYFSQKPMQ